MESKIGLGPISKSKIGLGPILKTKIGLGPILETKIGLGAILGKPPVSSCTGCLILMLNFMLFAIPIFGEKAIRKLFKRYFAKTALLGRSVEARAIARRSHVLEPAGHYMQTGHFKEKYAHQPELYGQVWGSRLHRVAMFWVPNRVSV